MAAAGAEARVTVFLGTWCSDSRRELSRWWRALDENMGIVGFEVRYVGIDRDKREPAELLVGAEIERVPTFVVRRAGAEVGRVVEESPHGIERDLLALLDGSVEGVISISSTDDP